jgi:hypothetical protein
MGWKKGGPIGFFPKGYKLTTSPFNPRSPPHLISVVFFPGEISLFFSKEIGKILEK